MMLALVLTFGVVAVTQIICSTVLTHFREEREANRR